MGALDNIQVVEVARGLAGPFCGQFLAEAGARVIKVEPLSGDYARGWGPPFVGPDSAVFASLNQGKESIALNLAIGEGQEVLRRLALLADVIVENLLPDEVAVPIIDYQELSEVHPELVYCSIRDFSEEGPLNNMPGSELVYQGMADYLNSLGRVGEPPIRVGADIAELGTGIFSYVGILAALYHRMATGEGQRVRVDKPATLMLMRNVIWAALSNPDDWYGVHCENYFYPPEHGVQTGERPIYFMMRRGDEDLFDRLTIQLGMEWVAGDPRFADGGREAMGVGRYAPEVKEIWEAAFKDMTDDQVLQLVREHGGEGMPFMDYPSLAQHPQIKALGIFQEAGSEGPAAGSDQPSIKTVGVPWDFSHTPRVILGRAPGLGEHTEEVLDMLGYTRGQVRTLREQGAIGPSL